MRQACRATSMVAPFSVTAQLRNMPQNAAYSKSPTSPNKMHGALENGDGAIGWVFPAVDAAQHHKSVRGGALGLQLLGEPGGNLHEFQA